VARILLMEPEDGMRQFLDILLAAHEVVGVGTGAAGLELLARGSDDFDLVLTDLQTTGYHADHLLDWLRDHDPGLPAVVFTCYDNEPMRRSMLDRGAFEYLLKHCANAQILDTVARAAAARRHR
jgi:DNA-binding NtrC family response regulator